MSVKARTEKPRTAPDAWRRGLIRGVVFASVLLPIPLIAGAEERFEAVHDDAPTVQDGYAILQSGEFDSALSIFDAVLEDDASNVEALLGRALIFSEQQEHERAFASYDAIVQRFPDHAFAWNGRGLAAFNLENFDTALDSFEKATADEPVKGFFYESIAWTHMCRGEFRAAAEAAKTASLMYNREGQVSLYPLLIAYFSYLELGDTPSAERALKYARGNVRSPAWPLPVLEYVSSNITQDELISFVTNSAEETEAHTYIGMVLRLSGDKAAARHLDWVSDRGDPRVFEYTLARTLDRTSGVAVLAP